MIVYHVTSLKKLNKYIENGEIRPPCESMGNHRTSRKNEYINRKKDYFKIAFPRKCRKIGRTFQSGKGSL